MVVKKIIMKAKEKAEGIMKKKSREEVEVNTSVLSEEMNVNVKVDNLKDFSDTERIQQLVRNGSILVLRIRDLRERDISELKRAVEKLKRTCMAMDGDIVGVDEDYLIITPSYAKIYRGRAA